MANVKSLLAYLKGQARWPKSNYREVEVPTMEQSAEEWMKMVQAIEGHETRMDNLNVIFACDEIEEGDDLVAASANACIKGLYFKNKPSNGHRYVLTYLYHWDTAKFKVSIVDLNESLGSTTTILDQYEFEGGTLSDLKDGNGNVIGKIYADVSGYTNVIAIADKAAARMPYCNEVCWRYNQDMVISERMKEVEQDAASTKDAVDAIGEVVSPTLLGSAGTEPSDVVKCAAANAEVKALFLSTRPSSGHRYVLNYLYLQTSDNMWFFTITDLNVSAGTSTAVVTNHRAADKTVTTIVANGVEIGQALFDSTNYTLIGDQGEGLARLPYLLSPCFDKMSQQALKDAELASTTTVAKNAAARVDVLEEELFPTMLGTDGEEASDVVKCAAANEELKALYLSVKPQTGHRFVVTQLYLQSSDNSWYYTIQDLNISAGTSTILVNALYAQDKTASVVKDTNGNDIGFIILDSTNYTLIADQGEGARRLPYLLDACYDATVQTNIYRALTDSRLAVLEKKANVKRISVWGDSITWGSAASANSECYCGRLQTLLSNAGYGHKVVNCGVGGDNMPTILGRMGATMLYLTRDLTIPKNASSHVVVDTVENYVQVGRYLKAACAPNEQIQLMMQGDLGRSHIDDPERDSCHTVNPVLVNGVECEWTWEPVAEGRVDEGEYWLKVKTTQTNAVVLKAGSPIYPHGAKLMGDVSVFAMGTNGGFSNASEYVAMVEKAVDALGTGKYIVCSPYGGTALSQQGVEGLQTLEAALTERFGARFFNWRKYLVEEGLTVEGLTATSADTTAIAQGKCPPSLLADEVHPNSYGHDAIAQRLYQMMEGLGYFQ